ncbi:MAG: hypothetical protein E6G39_04365 [Actinobacteria bacterium]|nr:MAG: hypothetical protein E6G39_04365 [Actinomycetota bacterium]
MPITLRSPGQQVNALDRLDRDYDNLRAALAFLIEARRADDAARMVRPMVTLFNIRHPREGFAWFQAVIAIADDMAPSPRARLMADASFAAMNVGDPRSLIDYAVAAVDAGGEAAPVMAFIQLSFWHYFNGDSVQAIDTAKKAIDMASADPTIVVLAHFQLVSALGSIGSEAEVRELVPGFLDRARRLASPTLLAVACSISADALTAVGHASEASVFLGEALALADAGGPLTAAAVRCRAALALDDPHVVVELMRAALPVTRDHLSGFQQTVQLIGAAKAAHALGRHREAAQLIGAYRRGLEIAGVRGATMDKRAIDGLVTMLERVLTPAEFTEAIEQGRRLEGDEPIQLGIEALGASS